MKTKICSTLVVVSALFAAVTSDAQAQGAARLKNDEMIPRELALAIFSNFEGMFGKLEITVGALSPQLAKSFTIPSSSTVIGSLNSAYINLGIVRSALRPDSAFAEAKRALNDAGWRQAPPASRFGGGFVPARAPEPLAGAWCSPDRKTVGITVKPGPGSGSTLHYMLVERSMGSCNPELLEDQQSVSMLPTLFDPDDAERMPPKCANLRSSSSSSGTGGNVLTTALTPSQLMSHYAKQLADSGWVSANDSPDQPLTSIFFKKSSKDDGGVRRLVMTISVPASSPSCRVIDTEVMSRD